MCNVLSVHQSKLDCPKAWSIPERSCNVTFRGKQMTTIQLVRTITGFLLIEFKLFINIRSNVTLATQVYSFKVKVTFGGQKSKLASIQLVWFLT